MEIDRWFAFAGLVYVAALLGVGLPAVFALIFVFSAALGAVGLGGVATSSIGMVVIWGLSVLLALQLAAEVTAVIVGGYDALTRGSPSVAVARCLLLTAGALAVVAAVTWAGLSVFLEAPGPIAAVVAAGVGLAWLLVLYRTSTGFVEGLRTDGA